MTIDKDDDDYYYYYYSRFRWYVMVWRSTGGKEANAHLGIEVQKQVTEGKKQM